MGGTVKLFVDTNIILDSLARRQPFEKKADLLFSLGFCKECELWTSASQFTDAFYIHRTGLYPHLWSAKSIDYNGKERY